MFVRVKRRWMYLWEFCSKKKMFRLLVGNYYGLKPHLKEQEIACERRKWANIIVEKTNMNNNSTVLELGSGCGYMTLQYSRSAREVHACDISKSFLKYAKKECRSASNIIFHRIKFLAFNFEFISPGSIDIIVSSNVFIHFTLFDIYLYFKEFRRIIARNGIVYIDFANAEFITTSSKDLFENMAKYYEMDSLCFHQLMHWHMPATIIMIAEYFNFKLVAREYGNQLTFRYVN